MIGVFGHFARMLNQHGRPCLYLLLLSSTVATGQMTLADAVRASLNHSPRVKLAADDLQRAQASVRETKGLYIPSVVAAGGAGDSYGITLSVPTIFTVNAQSLIYSNAQRHYLKASHLSVESASFALQDVREQVEEDAALTYIGLDHAQQRAAGLSSESADTDALYSIVQKRYNAGLESDLELSRTKRQVLGIKLQQLQLEDEISKLQQHLNSLTGVPADFIHALPDSVPNVDPDQLLTARDANSASEHSAVANAEAKQQRAQAESSYSWRPSVGFAAQYGRVSPINNVSDYYNLRGRYNVAFGGVTIQLPIFDASRRARADESRAEAAHAQHEVQVLTRQREEDRLQISHSLQEITIQTQIAELDLSIAEGQLRSTRTQLDKGADGGPVLTPKEEQYALIQVRQRSLDLLDMEHQKKRLQISVLRMNGRLEEWLHLSSLAGIRHTP